MAESEGAGESFLLLPALDVLKGRCVRMAGGDRRRLTVEGGDPAAAAARFTRDGATFLHLVDLDGAFGGGPALGLVERVVAAAGPVPVQAGGGYRTLSEIEAGLAAGAARIVIGTGAASPAFLAAAAARFGERLVVAIDARDGRVTLDGWTRAAPLTAVELALRCAAVGIARLLVTSTVRDGSLAGPDLPLLTATMRASRLPVLAAGGVASLDDLLRLRELGCEGAVVGSALWLERFRLADALALLAGAR
ncbi:MAG: HisA/HisF-related TIM barrel protein [Solirubrobacterales bacterium]